MYKRQPASSSASASASVSASTSPSPVITTPGHAVQPRPTIPGSSMPNLQSNDEFPPLESRLYTRSGRQSKPRVRLNI